MDRHTLLGKEKIGKLIWRFSLPAIAGMVVNALYNVIDRIFVGRGVGSMALSGIAITMPFMMILMSFAMLVSIGAASLISIKLGEKKKVEAEIIIGNALCLSILIGISLSIICSFFIEPILIAFGGNGESLSYAKEFMQVILFSTIFMMIGFTLNSAIHAEGNPMMALSTMIIGSVINTILNPIFIFGLHLGVRGSALATLILQFITALWTFLYFMDSRNLLRLKFKNLKLNAGIVTGIIAIGLAPFVMQMAMSIMQVIANYVFGKYGGNVALAVVGIIGVISMLFIMPIVGINQGIQPIIGYNYGAKYFVRVKRTIELATIGATILSLAGFVAIFFFNKNIMMLFIKDDQNMLNLGSLGVKYSMITLPIVGFQIVGSAYFQAVGKFRQALFLNIVRQVVTLIPLLLILPIFFGLYGGIAAFPISVLISTALTAILIGLEWKNLNEKHAARQKIINPAQNPEVNYSEIS